MPITPQTLRLADDLRVVLNATVDAQVRDLVAAWARAWQEIAPDVQDALQEIIAAADEDRLTPAALRRSIRLQRALALVAGQLRTLTAEAGVRITGDLEQIVATAAAAQTAILDSQLPDGTSVVDLEQWSEVSAGALEAIVRRTTEQITQILWPLSDEAYAAVQAELVRSVAAGSNPRVAARRMVARARGEFNGGLNRALVIARTEILDAHRAAAQESQAALGVDEWIWSASLRPRTCRACLSMHGRAFPATTPGPQGHQQCRCARLPKAPTWRDLGFDIDEPDDVTPDAAAYFDTLTEAQQRGILGDRGFEAWQAGEYPIEAWARKRKTPGWRDSYVPSRPPSVA